VPHRAPVAIAAAFASGLCLTLAACVDLFHSTSFETACEADAAACDRVETSTCFDPSAADACAPTRAAEAGPD
jgi:hypothetical protein